MVERPVDALAIALVVGRVFPFLGDDAVERISTAHLRTRGRGQELAGKRTRSSTNWPAGTSSARRRARSDSRVTSPRTETG